jgi:hypothetical protein
MAKKSKPKKKPARAKRPAPAAKKAKPTASGADESSESLRAMAKSFAARLLR